MKAFVTVLAVVAACLWSIVVWGGYLVMILTVEFLAGPNGGLYLPSDIGHLAGWIGSLFDSYGYGTALIIWLLGLGVIWLLRKLLHRLIGAGRPPDSEMASTDTLPRPASEEAGTAVSGNPASPTWGRGAPPR